MAAHQAGLLLGVGGGFVLVPAMLYLLGMGTRVVVGTSLFQILFVTIATTMVHAMTTGAVDIVLAGLLLLRALRQVLLKLPNHSNHSLHLQKCVRKFSKATCRSLFTINLSTF